MPIIRDLSHFPPSACHGAVAIGNFDGVHRGHLEIIRRLIQRALEVNGPAIVFTFDPHPVRLLRPEQCPPPLTWTERKAQLLAEHGVNKIVAYPTDEHLLGLSAHDFFDSIVRDLLQAKAMVEGPNFYFGHNREGNVELLSQLTASVGMSLDVVPPVEIDGALVSSSRIRGLIAAGEVATAKELLSAPYRIRGMVTHGAGRGAKLGFPTANLEAVDTLLPSIGVYAGRAWLDTISYPAAIHIGPNPTFGEAAFKVEIHLLDFEDTLYGQPLEVEFLARLRDVTNFRNEESLVNQLQDDVARTREIVG
ncbi:bifunctional riboflavin kinase/FAD synthetase [Bythopirellula polymerisocia]|uniref:Riboflavin biosynthesis protein n=1 Tax=Bythopirellula polymerisocia TaxID=2528003 RepID=A0A5C6CXS3_9BACT|nr:bifunctional riboflavin kinase/FAD synthetase [Bythopirellula polymerisocia]TWU27836.1 Riboflavin kinase [Bythopirellula polymerisocia]